MGIRTRLHGSSLGHRSRRLAGAAAALALATGCGDGGTGPDDLTLGLGELQVVTEPVRLAALTFDEAAEAREYAVVVHSADTIASSRTPVRLRVRGPSAAGSVTVTSSAPYREASGVAWSELPPELARSAAELELRTNMRRELLRARARPLVGRSRRGRSAGTPSLLASLAATGPPSAGDTLEVNWAVEADLDVRCDRSDTLTAVVEAVGERFALMADTAVAGVFSAADYAELTAVLDNVIFPVDSAYYGPADDIDGNGRVLILFTPEVNRLTRPGSTTFIGGLFWPGDLATSATCPAGNEAEILYLQAPDPTGRFSTEVSIEKAKRNAQGVAAHELQHLLTAEQRVFDPGGFDNLEDTWLSEGFAHIAEEVVGLALADLATRSNLTLGEAIRDQVALSAFNVYQLPNLLRLGFHMENPTSTRAFGTDAGRDPGGEGSLRMRGNAWLFLRWLADQYGPAGGGGPVGGSAEHQLFRELSTGGPRHAAGRANITRAVRVIGGEEVSWRELVALYEPALEVDDAGPVLPAPRTRVATWNLRQTYGQLHESNVGGDPPFDEPYPLSVTTIELRPETSEAIDFELRAFTARYFLLRSSGPTPSTVLEVTSQSGTPLAESSGVQVSIVRLQ